MSASFEMWTKKKSMAKFESRRGRRSASPHMCAPSAVRRPTWSCVVSKLDRFLKHPISCQIIPIKQKAKSDDDDKEASTSKKPKTDQDKEKKDEVLVLQKRASRGNQTINKQITQDKNAETKSKKEKKQQKD